MANKTVIFDLATFADAVQKASRVAPTKGAAFDKAAGILLSCDASDVAAQRVVIRSTNLDTTYLQKLTPTETKNLTEFYWRIPSALLAGLVSSLTLSSGATIKFIDTGDGNIRVSSGSVLVRYSMIQGHMPEVPEFDTENMSDAHDFAQKPHKSHGLVTRALAY